MFQYWLDVVGWPLWYWMERVADAKTLHKLLICLKCVFECWMRRAFIWTRCHVSIPFFKTALQIFYLFFVFEMLRQLQCIGSIKPVQGMSQFLSILAASYPRLLEKIKITPTSSAETLKLVAAEMMRCRSVAAVPHPASPSHNCQYLSGVSHTASKGVQ